MRLSENGLQHRQEWLDKGYELPRYDRTVVGANTLQEPTWLHFGAGNIFRAFPAALQQSLLNQGLSDKGIIVCESFDFELIDAVYHAYDNLSILVTLKADGSVVKTVVGSVTAAFKAHPAFTEDWDQIISAFTNPSLQMVSFTVTEKGYALTDANGAYVPDVAYDLAQVDEMPRSLMAKIAWLMYQRYTAGKYPLALVSMDNFANNGDRLKKAVMTFAQSWVRHGLVSRGFVDFLNDTRYVTFPFSMIDKITPRPDAAIRELLVADGLEDAPIIETAKGTFTAPFINAEETQYLVVEDIFPNGRPPLEAAGVYFTDRDTVNMVETMKVCTCLNPLHTALAIFGCLLGYKTIHDEMADPQLHRLVEILGYQEGLPVVADPKIINPQAFLHEVLTVRLPNPFIPDSPQRIATDTSLKLPIRFGETVKAYTRRPDLNVAALQVIPLVYAAWCRYLLGVDDNGVPMALSKDPLLPELQKLVEPIKLGEQGPFCAALRPILSNKGIFGFDMYEIGLAERVEQLFAKLVSGTGAVRSTLSACLSSMEKRCVG